MRRKVFVGVLLLFFLLIVAVLGLVWGTLSTSLPTLDGNLEAAGLERPVEVGVKYAPEAFVEDAKLNWFAAVESNALCILSEAH